MKSRMKYFLLLSPIIIVAIMSLAITNFETVMGMGIWLRKFVVSGTLDRQDVIKHFSFNADTRVYLFPTKTIDGERIGSIFFFQCLANKRDVDIFTEKYKIRKVTSETERKDKWMYVNEHFKKSRLTLPEYNVGEIFYDTNDRLNLGPLFIYISDIPTTQKSNSFDVLVTFFWIRI